jgi:hypothetical protein
MPNYVVYDPASVPIPNQVTAWHKSFPEERAAELGPNVLVDPDVSGLDKSKPAKVVGGTTIENFTQAEIDQLNAHNEATSESALRQASKDIYLTPATPHDHAIKLGFETLAEIIVSEINVIRANFDPQLPARTNAQIKNAFKTTYEAKVDSIG